MAGGGRGVVGWERVLAQLGALAFYVATQKAWPQPNMGLWLVKIHVNNINNAGRGQKREKERGRDIPEKGN